MPVSVTLYNHTARKIQAGEFPASDSYIINLYSVLPTNATATTKAAAESGATQLTTGNGYTQNAKTLSNVTISTVTTNDSAFTFDPVNWDATGAGISADYALICSATQSNSPPLARIDFGGTITAAAGTQFRITPNAGGFITVSNAG